MVSFFFLQPPSISNDLAFLTRWDNNYKCANGPWLEVLDSHKVMVYMNNYFLHSISSTLCLTIIWSKLAKYSSPGGTPDMFIHCSPMFPIKNKNLMNKHLQHDLQQGNSMLNLTFASGCVSHLNNNEWSDPESETIENGPWALFVHQPVFRKLFSAKDRAKHQQGSLAIKICNNLKALLLYIL